MSMLKHKAPTRSLDGAAGAGGVNLVDDVAETGGR